ncbi:CheR family methyltransferase [Iodobacter arcticus]|uniref:CheR family methyltransferase n=1 Tax=Iodobacter arcticus TaxID=590593 RepID=A0ABW2QVJ9_9NEIS
MKAAWFDDLIRLVLTRTGIVVREQDSPLLCKEIEVLSSKQLGLTPTELLMSLHQSKTESSKVWRELLALLTVGESYFFRDQGQFSLLSDHILPELIAHKCESRRLRIWSAACSSGEEAYSIAIMISQLLPILAAGQQWDITIVASDINQAVLDKARAGIYSAWSFRRVDPAVKEMYFTKQGDGWKINQDIQNKVHFCYGNLLEDQYPSLGSALHDFDLIICRNVFIYFQAETVNKIASKLADCLNEHGYLIAGHGELGLRGIKGLETKSLDNLVVYKKGNTTPIVMPPVFKPIAAAMITIPMIQAAPTITVKPIKPAPVFAKLLQEAKTLANQGQYDMAALNCQQAISMNQDSPQPHFVLAQIAEVQGRRQESKVILKKALYLDHEFLPGYVELFNIYLQEDNKKLAGKMLASALHIVRNLPGHTPVHLYDETNASELLTLLEQFQTSL